MRAAATDMQITQDLQNEVTQVRALKKGAVAINICMIMTITIDMQLGTEAIYMIRHCNTPL
jgi:hypothetical protein